MVGISKSHSISDLERTRMKRVLFLVIVIGALLEHPSYVTGCRSLVTKEKKYPSNYFEPSHEIVRRGTHDWSYDKPSKWWVNFGKCAGARQSPINIINDQQSGIVTNDFIFVDYDKPLQVTMHNNGHTVSVKLKNKMKVKELPYITGGSLVGQYAFHELHFHWSKSDMMGSEHWLQGRSFPGELHIVHFNRKYGNIESAINHEDGLAVLGIFLELSHSGRTAPITQIAKSLGRITRYNAMSDVPVAIQLGKLLPNDKAKFYRYQGSLTTPPCREVVTWTVFANPIPIAYAELIKFRTLLGKSGKPLINTVRAPQRRNGRKIYKAGTDIEAIFVHRTIQG